MQFGGGIVFIEGLPDYPDANRLWHIVERNRVTLPGHRANGGARPPCSDRAEQPPAQDISSLRAFASTGEAWDEPTWRWLFETVGGARLPILNYTGGTETGGGILSCYTIAPQSPASFSGPAARHGCRRAGRGRRSKLMAIGELVMHNTWPGMTHAFWRDPKRYLDTYWGRWPGHLGPRRSGQR